ncbi:hypothetical protein DACRYDRAFT_113322 [Dacryopinax primogenitus]|uniref:Uncharacterized protein n=1 Tax=Dacryopinax primogenitus (strain DJM 731) TaxID=1858805 RepID=M5G8Z5_DACPD|nr:uncharacterized protein DACRYDRAFT_113322 [Dacryopinax primogenitus]EJU06676.1 hypothetical protein DACRYDRAFT_113322 [Dacryopinax primogenitus]
MPRHTITALDSIARRLLPSGAPLRSSERRRITRGQGGKDRAGNQVVLNPGVRRSARQAAMREKQSASFVDVEEENGEEEHDEEIGGKEKTRRRRRQRFSLGELELSVPPAELKAGELPPPSSDLLKTIHHMAASQYASQSLLFQSSARAKRERRLARLKLDQKNRAKHGGKMTRELGGDGPEEESEEEDEESRVDREGDGRVRDLYRAFDGSALAVLGVLLQEHIKHQMLSKRT